MSENSNLGNFDIESLIDQYNGKRIEDIFPNHCIIENGMGRFIELIWIETELALDMNLNSTKRGLISKLRVLDRIGEKVEKTLHERGINSLADLKMSLRYQISANNLLELIKCKDFTSLMKNKNIHDLDVLFCFKKSDFLFLDIETLGLFAAPVILIGIGYYKEENFEIRLLFARDLDEEMAILEHLRKEIFPNFRCFVTFNGKSFDIPFLVNRFLYFFNKNPLRSPKADTNGLINTRFHHVDLIHCCRRKYKDQVSRFSLASVEKNLLDFERDNDLPGNLVGEVYRLYQEDRKKYVGLIKLLIEHNYYDVYSMPLIFGKLLS
ncbi:MAG: ribonuclease H-like domain-containing protein [Promethearchaeota archaeon]